jgi:hypothetical protein
VGGSSTDTSNGGHFVVRRELHHEARLRNTKDNEGKAER